MEKVARKGYIILLTLLVISAITVLLTSVVHQSISYQRSVRLAADKARARMLALSSLELAMSQLSTVVPKEEKTEGKKNDKEKDEKDQTKDILEPVQKWLLKVLPSINHWQTIEITEPGLEGTIKMYLACEEGKFNLAAFEEEGKKKDEPEEKEGEAQKDTGKDAKEPPKNNKKKKQQKKNGEPEQGPLAALDDLFKKLHDVSMKEAFKRFLAEHKRLPEDATELLRIPYFAKLKDRLFTPLKKEHRGLYIMDLFTVRPKGSETVNPWLLTASAKTLLGIRESKGELNEEFVKKIKPNMNWEQDWDEVLAPRYGKNFAAFDPAIQKVFASAFEAKAFSVVSYCTVGSVTQKIFAVLEVAEPDEELSPKSVIFKVTKLYWL